MTSVKYLPGLWTRFRQWWNLSESTDKSIGQMVHKIKDIIVNSYFATMDKSMRIMRFFRARKFKTFCLSATLQINISSEWITWLRKTHVVKEEIIKKQRAVELEMEGKKNSQLIKAERDFHPKSFFPLYRDLEVTPGQTYLLNRGFYIADLPDNPNLLEHGERKKLSFSEYKVE